MGLQNFLDVKKFYNFEGDRGIERLNVVLNKIGYKESGFQYGSPVEEFLKDNPGAIEKMLEFVEEYFDEKFDVVCKDEDDDEDDSLDTIDYTSNGSIEHIP